MEFLHRDAAAGVLIREAGVFDEDAGKAQVQQGLKRHPRAPFGHAYDDSVRPGPRSDTRQVLHLAQNLGAFEQGSPLRRIVQVAEVRETGFRMSGQVPGDLLNHRAEAQEQHPLRAKGPKKKHLVDKPPGRQRDQRQNTGPDHDPAWQHPVLVQVCDQRLHQEREAECLPDLEHQRHARDRADVGVQIQKMQAGQNAGDDNQDARQAVVVP